MRFVKIFWGDSFEVEDEINECAEKENLNIISTSISTYRDTLFMTVVFEKQNEDTYITLILCVMIGCKCKLH